ncbi:MAG: response regulator transcription factor [Acidobacteriota bacterium]
MASDGNAAGTLVLVVDDEPNIRETIAFVLEMEGFRVATAEDGEVGLAEIARLRPTIVVLDAMMPRRDGFEVCRAVRSDPALAGVRIVMVTALGQQADRERAMAAGADHYLTKPFDEDELLALLRTLAGGETTGP